MHFMEKKQIRVIIADDHAMLRETWKILLHQNPAFSVIAECTNGAEAIELAQSHNPDIILMDVNMSPVNGFEATQEITQTMPGIKIIGISINNQPAYARNMIKAGASGYVTKNSSLQEIMEAITEVANGEIYICREIKSKMKAEQDE